MITEMGNASPIRKAFVAFRTAFATNPFVVMAFEGRIDPDSCNAMALQFGKHLSMSVIGLPSGVFNLSDEFYETDAITVKIGNDKFKTFPSVGAYADSLNCGDEDYLDSEHWLGVVAELFSEAFLNENIPFPSKENLERMFVVGDNYVAMQKDLQNAFSTAKIEGKLEDLLLDVMSEYHKAFMAYAAENLIKDGPEMDEVDAIKRIYSMLPFEIVSHQSVGAVYDGILPVVLASGINVDQDELFHKRVERGQVFLKEYVGEEFDEDDALAVLTKAISEKPRGLQPLLPGYLTDELHDEATRVQLAGILGLTIFSDAQFDVMPTPYVSFEDLMKVIDGISDDEEEEEEE